MDEGSEHHSVHLRRRSNDTAQQSGDRDRARGRVLSFFLGDRRLVSGNAPILL